MSYDRRHVPAPRLTGPRLRAFVRLLEQPVAGRVVREGLSAQVDAGRLREVEVDTLTPRVDPLPGHPGPTAVDRNHGPAAGRALAEDALSLAPEPAAGFRYVSVRDLTEAFRAGHLSPVTLAHRVLQAAEAERTADPPSPLFAQLKPDDVLLQAEASAKRWRNDAPLSVFDGVPVAVKDELDQVPYATTGGTTVLGKAPAVADADPVARLREAGALLLGKSVMHELGSGLTGINPHYGTPRNPHNPKHICGGSSSGSSAIVAAGIAPVALACDAGGSIRIPAALTGVYGLKPTRGRVSTHGSAPLAATCGHTGPIAATAGDLAAAYAMIAGPDPKDPSGLHQPPPHLGDLGAPDLSGLTLGIYREWFDDAEPGVVSAAEALVKGLQAQGATVRAVSVPELHLQRLAHLVIIGVEMACGQAPHYARDPRQYGHDSRIALAMAHHLSAVDYARALTVRRKFIGVWSEVLTEVDAVLTPGAGTAAWPILPDALEVGEVDLGRSESLMHVAQPASLVGFPAAVMPAGYDDAGLPVGLQAIAAPWREDVLLRLCFGAERHVHRRRPARWRTLLDGWDA